MSHLFDFLCKSSEENEDFGSFMEFPDDMKNLDIPLTLEAPDLMSSEFFDSVLSMEQDNFAPTIDNDLMNICSDFDAQSPRSSDSGDSVTLGSDSNSSKDMLNINDLFAMPATETNMDSTDIMFNTQPTKLVVQQNPKRVIFSKPMQNSNKGLKNKQQVIRVQSISGNGRSLLLPVNVKNVKKIKIINANDLKMENIKVAGNNHAGIFKKIEKVDTSDDDDDIQPQQQNSSRFPPLHLTNEEKRLLVKEGIKLPSHYPLSKNEEKELKRIRRKIRNKISAQDSRKRKKEYVDKLEEKAKRTTEENEFLKKRIKLLRKQNGKLMEQMRKLQTVLFNTTSTKATPTTCLMIVLFSTLLVCLPNLRLSEKQELGEQHLFAARRALLFNQKANEEDVNMDEFLVFNKDDDSELESFAADEESENVTDNEFANFLSELAKKYENLPMDKNCSEMSTGNGNLGEFCRKYEDEIKNVISSMKEFLDTDATKVGGLKEKGFIEPDISDDEDVGKDVKWSSIKEEPPSKRMKLDDDVTVNLIDAKQE